MIARKLNSLMPTQCNMCSQEYCLKIEESSVFSCARCERGSHSCESMKNFRSALPESIPKGFVWLCPGCSVDITEISPLPETSTLSIPNLDNNTNQIEVNKPNNYQQHSSCTNEPDICPRYRRGACPHGINGNRIVEGKKCEFYHKKRCFKFCSSGMKGPRGCKKGSNCEFFHPILCKFSAKNRLCTNLECKYTHLKGTKRRLEDDPFEITSPHYEYKETKNNYGNSESRKPAKNGRSLTMEDMLQTLRSDLGKNMEKIKLDMMHQLQPWGNMSPNHRHPGWLQSPGFMPLQPAYPNQFVHPQPTQSSNQAQSNTLRPGVQNYRATEPASSN